MAKKDHDSKEPEKFLGPGAAGDVKNPGAGIEAFGVVVQEPNLEPVHDPLAGKESDKK